MKLTAKHEIFCLEYIKHKNGTKAYKAAYPNVDSKTARVNGSRLLTNANVNARIDQLLLELAERSKLTADDVINELKALAFWSINDFIEGENTIKDISKLKRTTNKPIVGIKVKTETRTIGGIEVVEKTVELKFADKRASLVDLGRHLGIFKEDNDQKTIKIKVSRK
jgi:phage terminase small subunit